MKRSNKKWKWQGEIRKAKYNDNIEMWRKLKKWKAERFVYEKEFGYKWYRKVETSIYLTIEIWNEIERRKKQGKIDGRN